MKISFSSSSSSFNGNLRNSSNAGCLSGILRRLLCTGSLPTYPSDLIKKFDEVEQLNGNKHSKAKEKVEASATPGIVARLMGLESMPEIDHVGPRRRNPGSITRSRSVNYMDYRPEFDHSTQGRHLRVRSEAPTFLELENEDFLILSFENVGGTKELGSKERKLEVGFGELKQRKAERRENRGSKREKMRGKERKSKRVEDQERKKDSSSEEGKLSRRNSDKPSRKINNCRQISDSGFVSSHNIYRKANAASKIENSSRPATHNEASDGNKFTKKKKGSLAVKKVEPKIDECNSENSSPVSVLDLGDFLIDPNTPLSDEDTKQTPLNSRSKQSPELANSNCPSPHSTCISVFNDRECRSIKAEPIKSKKADCHIQNYTELWGEISKLAEEDMVKESNWVTIEVLKLEDIQEIGIEFGQQILDQLLYEFLQEFAGVPMKNFAL